MHCGGKWSLFWQTYGITITKNHRDWRRSWNFESCWGCIVIYSTTAEWWSKGLSLRTFWNYYTQPCDLWLFSKLTLQKESIWWRENLKRNSKKWLSTIIRVDFNERWSKVDWERIQNKWGLTLGNLMNPSGRESSSIDSLVGECWKRLNTPRL